jgi:hypothetical protein
LTGRFTGKDRLTGEREEVREALPMKSSERLRADNPSDEQGEEERDERGRPVLIDEDVEEELNAVLPDPTSREERPSRQD